MASALIDSLKTECGATAERSVVSFARTCDGGRRMVKKQLGRPGISAVLAC